MKRALTIVLCVLACSCAALAGPRVQTGTRTCDFGAAASTSIVEFAVAITNTGDSELVIDKIRGCCGATIDLGSKRLPPGSNTAMRMKISLAGRQGAMNKSIYLVSNDSVEPFYELRVKGEVTVAKSARAATNRVEEIGRGGAATESTAPGQVTRPTTGGSVTARQPAAVEDEDAGRVTSPGGSKEVTGRPALPPVTLDYFYEDGCPGCRELEEGVLPDVIGKYGDRCVLRRYEIGIKTNFLLLVAYEKKLGIEGNEPVSVVVDRSLVLSGVKEIASGLEKAVRSAIEARKDPSWEAIPAVEPAGMNQARDKVRRFTLWMVVGNGLADGINPCAMATLVFFMSVLAVARISGWRLMAVGLSFCLASFATYVAIGFGLLKALYVMRGYPYLRTGIDVAMLGFLLVAAYLSFRDAWMFRKTGKAGDVLLKLPDGIRDRIHRIVKTGVGMGGLFAGGLLVGSAVTALESVCTGQMYVPTLVLVIKDSGGELTGRAWSYLLLYNAMFVLPLLAILLAVFLGLRTERLLDWSRRNVVVSKALLGLLFLALAALMWAV